MPARLMKPARSTSPESRSSTTTFCGSLAVSPRQASKRLRVSRSMPCSLLMGVGPKLDVRWYAEVGRARVMVRRPGPAPSRTRAGVMAARPSNVKCAGRHAHGYVRRDAGAPLHVRPPREHRLQRPRAAERRPRIPGALTAAGRVAAAALAAELARCPFDLAHAHGLRAHARELHLARPPTRGPDCCGSGVRRHRRRRASRASPSTPTAHGGRSTARSRVPGGESRIDALARYADGERTAGRHGAHRILLVVHDVPIRFLRNALLRADPLDGPVREVANLERLDRRPRRSSAPPSPSSGAASPATPSSCGPPATRLSGVVRVVGWW